MQGNILSGIQGHIDALVPAESTGGAVKLPELKGDTYKAKFKELVEFYASLNEEDYTPDSWNAFRTVYDTHKESYDSSFVMSHADEFAFERDCSELILVADRLVSKDSATATTNYQEYKALIDYFNGLNADDYTNYADVKESVDYFVSVNGEDIENTNASGEVVSYNNIATLQQYVDQLVRKDAQTVSLTDPATGVTLMSDDGNFTGELALEVQKYDAENWPYNMAGSWMARIPSTAAKYASYRIILRNKDGIIKDPKRGFTVSIPFKEEFDSSKISLKATYGISPEVDKERGVATIEVPQGTVASANGSSIFVTESLDSTDPRDLGDGVYSVQANIVNAGNTSVASMSNNTLDHSATLVKQGDDVYIYLNLVPMYVLSDSTPSYVGGFWCEKGEQADGDYYEDSEKVLSYYTNEDGSLMDNSIYDALSEIACIKTIQLKLEADCFNSDINGYRLCVLAPDMAAMNNLSYDEIVTDSLNCVLVITEPEFKGTAEMMAADIPSYDASALRWQIDYAKSLDGELYTGDSYAALTGRLEAAQAVYEDSASASADYEAQIAEVKAAIDGLQINPTKLGDTEAFAAYLDGVEGEYDSRKYTKSTYEGLTDAIAAARKYIGKENVTQRQLDAQRESVEAAIQGLKAKSASQLDVADLPDGEYTVDIAMKKAAQIRADSMSNAAVEHTIKLEVRGGRYYATLDFKGLTISLGGQDLFGHLGRLTQYVDGCTVDAETGNILDADGRQINNLSQAERAAYLTGTQVLSTQRNADGSDVVDCFNDGSESALLEGLYPDEVRFEVIKSVLGDEETTYAPLHVFVPVMESTGAGVGEQDVLMRIDWTSLALGYDAVDGPKAAEAAKAELNSAIADAKGISNDKGTYTAESYKALTDAIAEAEALVEGGDATADQLKAASDKIAAARKALVKASETPSKPAAKKALPKGKTFVVSGVTYKVTDAARWLVTVTGVSTSKKSLTINTAKYKGSSAYKAGTYKVTALAKGAVRKAKKLAKLTLGANVASIGKKAFAKARSLKTLTVKSKRLTKKSVKDCLKGSKVKTVKVPKAKRKAYRKIFTENVAGRKVAVK